MTNSVRPTAYTSCVPYIVKSRLERINDPQANKPTNETKPIWSIHWSSRWSSRWSIYWSIRPFVGLKRNETKQAVGRSRERPLRAEQVYCDQNTFDGGWMLVANIANTGAWFPGDSNLSPTFSQGTYSTTWDKTTSYYKVGAGAAS